MNTLALCIPAYNAAEYLPRLLQSAKDQAIPFDEILVYNDCSTDNTEKVAKKYGAKVINGFINKGCSFGKNQLVNYSTCNWIHFHDADDELLPNFTTLAHKWMSNPDCPDIVLFDYEYRDYNTNKLINTRQFDKHSLKKDPIAYAILEQINPFCGLYKKERFLIAGGYDTDPAVLYNEDVAFHIKMAINGCSFSAEHELSIINYRLNNSMSVSNAEKCARAQFHVLKKTADIRPDYKYQITFRLWSIIATLAACEDWIYVEKALHLSKKLGYRYSINDNKSFKVMTMLHPYFAVWFREKTIRLFKSHLRNNA